MGWSGEHLDVFDIRGCSFSDSGYVDAERSTDVTVGSFCLGVGERFCWRYDFCSDWTIDARVEAVGDIDAVRVVSGRRAGPPEWVGGPERFGGWEDSHTVREVTDIVVEVIDAGPVAGPVMFRERLWLLGEWGMVNKQQMRWTPTGAHRLLQIRTRVLGSCQPLVAGFFRFLFEPLVC